MTNKPRLLAALAAGCLIAGCGDDDGGGTSVSSGAAPSSSTTPTTPEPEPVQKPIIDVGFDGPEAVRRDQVTLRGTVTPANANVRVEGQRAAVTGTKWTKVVNLDSGDNEIEILGSKKGHTEDSIVATVTRKLSQAEKEQRRTERKQKFINAATTIPYNQLEKSPDRYAGDKVVYTGQIFQIQEEPEGGGVMLVAVTRDEFDLWDDNVWVNYEGSIKSAEDDVITFYGTVQGEKSYDTQAGGETYVPEIDAKYIQE